MLARDDRNTPVDWVARATALVPMIEAASDRIEAERRIVPEVIAALHEAGLFRMLLPASFGGGAADVVAFNQVIETIATADASTAWCLAQQVASTQTASYLDPKVAREIFAGPDGAVAWGPPSGAKAVVVDGGYIVNGRWRFASGSEHCPWLGGHCAVFEADGKPRLDKQGRPVHAHHAVPQGQGDVLRHLARDRAVRHRQQCLRGDRAVRAGGLFVLARSARRPPRRRSARQHSAA